MTAPPPKLDYGTSSYITLSSSLQPESITTAAASTSAQPATPTTASNPNTLKYVGPVGSLPDEHIFEVTGIPSANPPDARVEAAKQQLQRVKGVSHVEVMVAKQRTSRNFEC